MSGRVSDWLDSLYNVYVETAEGVRPVKDEVEAWVAWFKDRRVAEDENVEGVYVITSFLCLRWGKENPPLVYETWAHGMGIERKWRYATRQQAQEGHDRIIQMLKSNIKLSEIN